MDEKSILGDNDIDDVRWLCSLTESELDLLMGLKNMVNMRAKKIGHEALAKKFDLRMLRTLSFICMEHLKGQLKDVPAALGFDCNLLKQNPCGSFGSMTVEDLYLYICSDQKKRITDLMSQILKSPVIFVLCFQVFCRRLLHAHKSFEQRFFQDMPPPQKQKTGD